MPGTLFVVATPIGNLEDLTFRALRTLKEVDLVAAEDTRRTRKLLTHYGISKPLVSLHEHNEHREAPRLVARLAAGESIALVSDAGTPGIADPGATLVRLAREAGLAAVPIPGPSAITAALSVSGINADQFVFMGFPPATGSARTNWFQAVASEPRPVVLFEAPHRFKKTSEEMDRLVKRTICINREITKVHEESVIRPTSGEVAEYRDAIGEIVVVVWPNDGDNVRSSSSSESGESAVRVFGHMKQLAGISDDEAASAAAAVSGLPARMVRKLVKLERYARNRKSEIERQAGED